MTYELMRFEIKQSGLI